MFTLKFVYETYEHNCQQSSEVSEVYQAKNYKVTRWSLPKEKFDSAFGGGKAQIIGYLDIDKEETVNKETVWYLYVNFQTTDNYETILLLNGELYIMNEEGKTVDKYSIHDFLLKDNR